MPRRFARPHRRGMFSGAAGSGGGFSPRQLGGLVLWLRSDLGITLNGSTVSAWADQSGNGNNVIQGTASSQPAYSAADSGFGGHPSLTFVSANSQSLRNAGWSQAQPLTIYCVGKLTSFAGSVSRVFVDGITTEVALYGTSAAGAAGSWSLFAGSVFVGGADDLLAHVLCGVVNGSSSVLAVDASAGSSGAAGANSSVLLSVGGGNAGTTFVDGVIAEVAIYGAAHTATQRQRMFQYLGARYGIAVS